MDCSCLYYIGAFSASAVVLRSTYFVWRLLYVHYIGHLFGLSLNLKSFKGWAVITGSTDGIGKAYALALAKKGIDLILISRNPSRLENTAKEIKEKHGVQIKVIAIDFSHNVSIYDKIKNEIGSTPVGILINNVGLDQWASHFVDVPNCDKVVEDIINVNITSCMRMISLILPQMVERKNGLILNVSSLSCVSPMCGFAIYGSVKACVNYFSRALTMECKSEGITVQSVVPGYVSTKMSRQKPSLISPTPDQFVACHLRTIGLSDMSFGYIGHTIMATVATLIENCFPESWRQSISIHSTKALIQRYKKKLDNMKKE